MDPARMSACNYAVRERDLDYAFGVITAAGFTNVDLWGGLPNYSNDPEECDPEALLATAEAHGIRLANLGTYPGRKLLTDGPEREWREMTRAIDNAALFGSRSIRVCPGHGEDPSIIPSLVPFFKQAAEYAESQGIYLAMENHKGSIAGNPPEIMKLVRTVGSAHFGILYEPANLMHCGVDYREALDVFRGHITHIHVKDSRVTDGTYERTMLGEGAIDWPALIRDLEKSGYDGDYALEYEIEKVIPIEEGLPRWFETFAAW